MTVSGISASSLASTQAVQNSPNKLQQFKQDFQQLGQDIASGNLTGAQASFANLPKPGAGQSSPTGTAIEQEFGQLGQDLQSGDLSGAQQSFTEIQTRVQNHFEGNPPQEPVPVVPRSPTTLSVTA